MTYAIVITDLGKGTIEWGVLVDGNQVSQGQANYWTQAWDQANAARQAHAVDVLMDEALEDEDYATAPAGGRAGEV